MQAFAIARHACHVHLGTKLGQAEGLQAAALPSFLSAQSPRLPLSNSIPLPQVEVTCTTDPELFLGTKPHCPLFLDPHGCSVSIILFDLTLAPTHCLISPLSTCWCCYLPMSHVAVYAA